MVKTLLGQSWIAGAHRTLRNGHSTGPAIQHVLRLHSGITGLLGMQPRSSAATHSAPRKTSAYGRCDKSSRRARQIEAPSRCGIS
ncbi:MAG: hypothetical protein C4535_01585 [Comamonadaceae bacterium]|nr:MAG: hypothetical protein C4535_01585 [Comamonadaceae bacterium]